MRIVYENLWTKLSGKGGKNNYKFWKRSEISGALWDFRCRGSFLLVSKAGGKMGRGKREMNKKVWKIKRDKHFFKFLRKVKNFPIRVKNVLS